jgi:uncharacterized OsmC-like protein
MAVMKKNQRKESKKRTSSFNLPSPSDVGFSGTAGSLKMIVKMVVKMKPAPREDMPITVAKRLSNHFRLRREMLETLTLISPSLTLESMTACRIIGTAENQDKAVVNLSRYLAKVHVA